MPDVLVLPAGAAASLYARVRGSGVRCWVMGGWGVDALLGRQTRDHHDLDVLVEVADLPLLHGFFAAHGLRVVHVWEESVGLDLLGTTVPSAFVAVDDTGAQLDVHVVRAADAGPPEQLFTGPWDLPADALTGTGAIAGEPVACVSAAAQLAMHRGYELPEHHRRDVELLRELLRELLAPRS